MGPFPVSALFDDFTLTSPKSVGADGKEQDHIDVNESVGFSSTLTYHGKSEQKFTYIVQILNKEGGTDYLKDFLRLSYQINHLLPHNHGLLLNPENIPYRFLYGRV